jgi:biopolymer transport protein ExbB/TolQ
MNTTVFKPLLIGGLLGAALFVMPIFLLRVLLAVLLIGAIMRLWGNRFYGRRFGNPYQQLAFADKIRNMTEEEYTRFRQQAPHQQSGKAKENMEDPSNKVN